MTPRPVFIEGLGFSSALICLAEDREKFFFVRLKCCYARINSCLDCFDLGIGPGFIGLNYTIPMTYPFAPLWRFQVRSDDKSWADSAVRP